MIVRDERANLEACLESARDAVDEICVVDTGSKDGTAELAAELGASVDSFRWQDNFAAARNASLGLASGQWVLVLDADERIVEPRLARERLMDFASQSAGFGGQVVIESPLAGGEGSETSLSLTTRFFPRAPEWFFHGRIHEQVLCDGRAPKRRSTGVRVEHLGYLDEVIASKDKLARNERLLITSLQQDGPDSYVAYHLGQTLALGGRHAEALEAFELAVEYCPDDAAYLAHLFEMGATSLRSLGHSRQALEFLGNIEGDYVGRADTCFLLALLAMDTGEFERARSGFEHCLTLKGTLPEGGPSSPAASSWAAATNLGVLAEVLGDLGSARRHYEHGLALRPGDEPCLAGLARLEGLDPAR